MTRDTLTFSLAVLVAVCGFLPAGVAADITGSVKVFKKDSTEPLTSSKYAVVYVDGVSTEAPKEAVVMTQHYKTFDPRLVVVVKGQEVDFLNKDRVRHNVFSNDPRNRFDLGRYPKGQSKKQKFDHMGGQRIYCNIHQKMVADVFVVPNRFFAVTGDDGKFVIKDIKPGTYTLKAWHIFGGTAETTIEVTEAGASTQLALKSQKLVKEIENHLNKDGKAYPKYGRKQYDD